MARKNANKKIYRPKLEELALQLYKTRGNQRDAEEQIAPQIKDILEDVGITKYDGKKVDVKLVICVKQEVNLKKLSKYVTLDTLYENNLLSINSIEKLEKFMKEQDITLSLKDYLKKGKPYEQLNIDLKKK